MRKWMRMVALTLAAVLVLAACSSDDNDDTDGASPPAADDTTAPGDEAAGDDDGAAGDTEPTSIVVASADSDLGTILVDGDGLTLYVFTTDDPGVSNCSGSCASTWPPHTVAADFVVGAGVDASLFSTITRDDGSTQLAVADQPLYRFAADAAPGDTNGQGVGGVWFVVSPDGERIES